MKNSSFSFADFPLVVFPAKFREIVTELHRTRLFPIAYTAASILFVVSLLVGGLRCLVTALGKTYANVYVALIGSQGAMKSRPAEFATNPLVKHDVAAILQFTKQLKEWEEANRNGQSDGTPRPKCPRKLVNDITPEGIGRILADNREGVGQYVDELTKAIADYSRYSSSRNEDMLLSLFSGVPMVVDRATRELPIVSPQTYLCLLGTTQTHRYLTTFADERYDSGLCARILAVPILEEEPLLWDLSRSTDDDIEIRYEDLLDRINSDRGNPAEYSFSAGASSQIQTWQNGIEERLNVDGHDYELAIFRKMQIYVLKFALILQIMWDKAEAVDNTEHVINEDIAFKATLLADYFFENACDLSMIAHQVTPMTDKEQQLYDAFPTSFTSEEGLKVAESIGLGKTSFYSLIKKIKGVLIEQPMRGRYVKSATPFALPYIYPVTKIKRRPRITN